MGFGNRMRRAAPAGGIFQKMLHGFRGAASARKNPLCTAAFPERFDLPYVARIRAGHPPTIKHFRTHFGALLRLKLRLCFSAPDVERLTDETTKLALDSIQDGCLSEPAKLPSHVLAICNNLIDRERGHHGQSPNLPSSPGAVVLLQHLDVCGNKVSKR